jgi:ADP-ribosyl-[dinitrogen reductase] hydrolase
MSISLEDRYRGCLLGLACGDAVGTAVEFGTRGSFPPVTGMRGGGPFSLQAGYWTDDTSMAMCLAESLCTKGGFDAHDQMTRYANWWQWGYWSSTGNCFDIGMTVRDALMRFMQTGDPWAGSVEPDTAGNGSLMRLAPVVMAFHPDFEQVLRHAAASSRTTHAAPEAVECCQLLAACISKAFAGLIKRELLQADELVLLQPKVAALAVGAYRSKSREEIKGSGYAVASLEAALWCFETTANFEEAVLTAANLGDDADTTAAITGQLAGAYYGVSAIPKPWLETLHMQSDISAMASALCALSRSKATSTKSGE